MTLIATNPVKIEANYTDLDSTAIDSVRISENQVFITYSSNFEKEYAFNCSEVADFNNNLCEVLLSLELPEGVNNQRQSVGGFIHRQIKSGVLVENK